MENKNISVEVFEEVGQIIDRLAVIYDEEDVDNQDVLNEISNLGKRLFELTGKTIEECEPFHAYWSYTDLDSIVERILMPKIEKKNLSNKELEEIIEKICENEYSEAENDYYLKVLEIETGIDNISDYFYYPDEVGLRTDADNDEIIKKILEDRIH